MGMRIAQFGHETVLTSPANTTPLHGVRSWRIANCNYQRCLQDLSQGLDAMGIGRLARRDGSHNIAAYLKSEEPVIAITTPNDEVHIREQVQVETTLSHFSQKVKTRIACKVEYPIHLMVLNSYVLYLPMNSSPDPYLQSISPWSTVQPNMNHQCCSY